jgi:hypothetical protein
MWRMRTIVAAVILSAVSMIPQAKADSTVKEYKEAMASSDPTSVRVMKVYILGMGEGIGWANTMADGILYCEPSQLALGVANFVDIINREIEATSKMASKENLDKMWIGLMLMKGLQSTFPCASK